MDESIGVDGIEGGMGISWYSALYKCAAMNCGAIEVEWGFLPVGK